MVKLTGDGHGAPDLFHNHPTVELATNTFVRVPVILQYDELPLIEIVQTQSAGFTTKIPIYHPDGTYLAKVVGSHCSPLRRESKQVYV